MNVIVHDLHSLLHFQSVRLLGIGMGPSYLFVSSAHVQFPDGPSPCPYLRLTKVRQGLFHVYILDHTMDISIVKN